MTLNTTPVVTAAGKVTLESTLMTPVVTAGEKVTPFSVTMSPLSLLVTPALTP